MSKPLFRIVIPRVPYPNVFSHIAMPPLGPLYVATSVKRQGNWDVEVIDELNWAATGRRKTRRPDPLAEHRDLQKRRPAEAVGFYGGLTSTIPRLLELASFYRSLGVHTVAGGAHVDALPEEPLRNGIEIVVHGEGEETILDILRAWSDGLPLSEIPGISYLDSNGEIRRNGKRTPYCSLDTRPSPDLDTVVELKRPYRIAPVERTRGCNYTCEFCIVNDRFGPSRSASPEVVAAEVETRVLSGYRHFFFVDDNFTQGRKDTLRLLSMLKEIQTRLKVRLNFTVQVRSSVGRDEELMQAMREAGVRLLCIGLESPIREELLGMEKHQTPEQIERDLKNLKRNGFLIHGMFIFGYPVEQATGRSSLTLREKADLFYSFIKRTAIDTIQVLKPVPVPGSRLAERLRKQNRIFPIKVVGWDKYDGNFLCFLPDRVSAKELQEQATRILRRFYSPFSFLQFPVLVFTWPVDFLRLGFKKAIDFARDPKARAKAALAGARDWSWALRAGFSEASRDMYGKWRNAVLRSLGSVVVTNWLRTARHSQFLRTLQSLQVQKVSRDPATAE